MNDLLRISLLYLTPAPLPRYNSQVYIHHYHLINFDRAEQKAAGKGTSFYSSCTVGEKLFCVTVNCKKCNRVGGKTLGVLSITLPELLMMILLGCL